MHVFFEIYFDGLPFVSGTIVVICYPSERESGSQSSRPVKLKKLNAMTIRKAYQLQRMDERISLLGNATIFSTTDCHSGFWQIEILETSRVKTTFSSHHSLFQFIRMPLGLKNAPAFFQQAVDILLSEVKWQSALVCLDDIIVY